MIGDLFLVLIIICMAVLVGYPLFRLVASNSRFKGREGRKA